MNPPLKLVFHVERDGPDGPEIVVEKSETRFHVDDVYSPGQQQELLDALGLTVSRFLSVKLGVSARVQTEREEEMARLVAAVEGG